MKCDVFGVQEIVAILKSITKDDPSSTWNQLIQKLESMVFEVLTKWRVFSTNLPLDASDIARFRDSTHLRCSSPHSLSRAKVRNLTMLPQWSKREILKGEPINPTSYHNSRGSHQFLYLNLSLSYTSKEVLPLHNWLLTVRVNSLWEWKFQLSIILRFRILSLRRTQRILRISLYSGE